MEKKNLLLHTNNSQIGNLDINPIYVKPRTSFISFFKSNIVQLSIIFISLITIIVLSFQVNTQVVKLNKMKKNIEAIKANYGLIEHSLKGKENELAILKESKENFLKIAEQTRNNLLDSSQELQLVNSQLRKIFVTIEKYQQQDSSESLSEIKRENDRLLKELSMIKITNNGLKNERMKNKVSEILTNEDIQLLEQWTGKKLMFACFNTHIQPMSGRQFHELCDMYSETISLIELDNAIIGGYTSQDWKGNQDKYDDKAFIFNLTNKKKFNVHANQIAICPSEFDLPVFSKDIALTKDVFFVQFPHSYGTYEDKEMFGIDSTLIQPKIVEVIVVH